MVNYLVHTLHERLCHRPVLLIQQEVGVKCNILHFVLLRDKYLGAAGCQINRILHSKIALRVAHVEAEVLDVAIVVFGVHQVIIDLLIDLL